MRGLGRIFLSLLLLNNFLQSQVAVRGNAKVSGVVGVNIASNVFPGFFAQFPQSWVNSALTTGTGFCPTSGFDAIKTMKAAGGDYTPTLANLRQAKLDQIAANQNWLLKIDAGTNLHGSTFNSDTALVTIPANTGGVTKCLVIQSSTHNTDALIVCAQSLDASIRNPGCTNDIAKMWKLTVDSTPVTGNIGIYFARGDSYTVLEDAEITIAPGSAQSASGVKVILQAVMECNYCGIAYSYIHGYDPGDSGQPGIGSGNAAVDNATGVCLAWNRSGTLSVTNGSPTATWVSGDRFGMDFADATHSAGFPQVTAGGTNALVINGTNFGIASHDPAASDTVLTLASNFSGTTGTYTFTLQNPKTTYATGCGDDSRSVQFNCNNCFLEFNYFEKIHWSAGESHVISSGFSVGPTKDAHNHVEGGAVARFTGGAEFDIRGGPVRDVDTRASDFSIDLGYRFLSANAQNSPKPPFGCGPLDNVAAHNTCPFKWGHKARIESKGYQRVLIDGNIVDGSWSDAQSGYCILGNPRTSSGGDVAGIFDPTSGEPTTLISDVRYSNNWIRNCAQIWQMSSRSQASSGNGGGISKASERIDYINNVMTNDGDTAQFGSPGTDIIQWGGGGSNVYLCNMSGDGTTAHAACQPIAMANYAAGIAGTQNSNFDVSSVIRSGAIVTMKLNGHRMDPTVGGTVTVANVAGWNGSFTITGVLNTGSSTICTTDYKGDAVPPLSQPQPCIRADGTFGDTIIYTDNQGADGTLCSSLSTCNATGIHVILPSLAFKMVDLAAGDYVYTHDCTISGYNVGATSPVAVVAPTVATGLDVYYPSTATGAATCLLENNAGFPRNTTFQHNTVLSSRVMSISGSSLDKQFANNYFMHNLFAMTTGNGAVLTCTAVGGQGTAVYACWDGSTFQFFDNAIEGSAQANACGDNTRSCQWSVVPGGSTPNKFASSVTCAGATADPTCLGFTSYMSGTTFPNATCIYDGSNPTDCGLMALPWSSNFSLSMIVMVGTSSYLNEGADLTALQSAFTSTQYTCPAGASCGTGPKPD